MISFYQAFSFTHAKVIYSHLYTFFLLVLSHGEFEKGFKLGI